MKVWKCGFAKLALAKWIETFEPSCFASKKRLSPQGSMMMCNLVHSSVLAHVLQQPRESSQWGLQWNDSFSLQAFFLWQFLQCLRNQSLVGGFPLQLSWALHMLGTLSAKLTLELHLEDAATKHILLIILRLTVQNSSVVVNSVEFTSGGAVRPISNTALLPTFLFIVLPSWL